MFRTKGKDNSDFCRYDDAISYSKKHYYPIGLNGTECGQDEIVKYALSAGEATDVLSSLKNSGIERETLFPESDTDGLRKMYSELEKIEGEGAN